MFPASDISECHSTKVIPPTAGDNACKYFDTHCTAAECGYCTGNYMPNYTGGPSNIRKDHPENVDKVDVSSGINSP